MFTRLKIGLIALGILLGFTPAQVSNIPSFGATIATTSLTDTLGTFRTNVNTSLENLNTQLNTVSSTVSGFGSIVAYNSPLPVANGGTSLSTGPSDSTQFLGANGTTPAWKSLVGVGITVSTTTTSTILTSQNIDTSQNFTWTGGHTFSAGVTSTGVLVQSGTSTFSGNTSFSQIPTAPTSTPTLGQQLITKAYHDTTGLVFASGTISSITPTSTPVLTTITHGLGVVPKQIIISASAMADGQTLDQTCVGTVAYDSNGAILYGTGFKIMSDNTLPAGISGTNIISSGTGSNRTENLTIYATSTNATTFTIEVDATLVNGYLGTSQVSNVKWVAYR